MISWLLSTLLSEMPKPRYTAMEQEAYEELAAQYTNGQNPEYNLPYPKLKFLQYLSEGGHYLFHGSNNKEIDRFQPRKQTLYNNELVEAVFSAADPNWSVFYAVLNRSNVLGGFRNGCIYAKGRRFHFYSLNASTISNQPWTSGSIYILPKSSFRRASKGRFYFDEWISEQPVTPIAKLDITVDDFYFINKVAVHNDNESLMMTYLLYKLRINRRRQAVE